MRNFILLSVLCLSLNGFAQRNPEITANELKKDVNYLASDSLKGRKPGTPEADLAASFIRKEFIADHLKLLFEKGYQSFEIVTDATLGPHNVLKFNGFNGEIGQNFTPVVYSSNAGVSAYVAFAGIAQFRTSVERVGFHLRFGNDGNPANPRAVLRGENKAAPAKFSQPRADRRVSVGHGRHK